jgi:hypothetical protein
MTKFLIVVTMLLGSVSVQAEAATRFPSPEAFVQSLRYQVSQSAQGDLNGDGLDDWVGAVRPVSGEDSSMYRIMVLLQKSPGDYELSASSSRFFSPDSGSDPVDLDIEIKKATFYVSLVSHSQRCATASRAQFRLKRGQWRLIGATYRQSDTTDRRTRWYSQDANLVTGDEIFTVQGSVKQRSKFSPLVLDLQGFPLEYDKAFRTKAKPVCG